MNDINSWFETLRSKWSEVPLGTTRIDSNDLLKINDEEMLQNWTNSLNDDTTYLKYSHRGWYYDLYFDIFKDKKIIDLGSGLGFDSITFSKVAKSITCIDLVKSNLEFIKKLAKLKNINNLDFFYMESIEDLSKLDNDFDVIFACGSLLHIPFEYAKIQLLELLKHTKSTSRLVMLTYPKERWEKDGSPSFFEWGKMTDGEKTPYAEYYNQEKILKLIHPYQSETILNFNFYFNSFNWFDIKVLKESKVKSYYNKIEIFDSNKENLLNFFFSCNKIVTYINEQNVNFIKKDNIYTFECSSTTDHLTSNYFDLPKNQSNKIIELYIDSNKKFDSNFLTLDLQYDDYVSFGRIKIELGKVITAEIPKAAKSVRIVIYSDLVEKVQIPEIILINLIEHNEK